MTDSHTPANTVQNLHPISYEGAVTLYNKRNDDTAFCEQVGTKQELLLRTTHKDNLHGAFAQAVADTLTCESKAANLNAFQKQSLSKLATSGFIATPDADYVRVWGFYRLGTWILTDWGVDGFIERKTNPDAPQPKRTMGRWPHQNAEESEQ